MDNTRSLKLRDARREPDPIPDGKLSVVWRKGRVGYVVTAGGNDILGVSPCASEVEAIDTVLESGYVDKDGRLADLRKGYE